MGANSLENFNPGPDRVVFNPELNGECTWVGAITHRDAKGNGFVECEWEDANAAPGVAPSWFLAASGVAAIWALGM